MIRGRWDIIPGWRVILEIWLGEVLYLPLAAILQIARGVLVARAEFDPNFDGVMPGRLCLLQAKSLDAKEVKFYNI
ncbi:hypothetical protein ADN01_16455 [Levilinea saccharolytica]|uniref:Uncharacterized protein n=1 Tax=Levilinea saccharolytica TaxID=229921 RepID=A0A0P6XCI3_9CHLR|nr:hypothetical protein ADN01_16455 [Levilinea saccharolytica]